MLASPEGEAPWVEGAWVGVVRQEEDHPLVEDRPLVGGHPWVGVDPPEGVRLRGVGARGEGDPPEGVVHPSAAAGWASC